MKKMRKGFVHITFLSIFFGIIVIIAVSLFYRVYIKNKINNENSLGALNVTSQQSVYNSKVAEDIKITEENKENTTDGFIKNENGWNYYENKEFDFTFKVPEKWSAVIFTDHFLLSHQDYVPLVRVLTPKGNEDMCNEFLEIGYPISVDGDHKDIGKNYEKGLEGLKDNRKGSKYGYFDGYKALFYYEPASTPPENFQGGWCYMNNNNVYIDLGNRTIMEITYTYNSDSGEIFDEILNSINFKD